MKCRLCDRPTAAGTGKLCVDCAKALQRARGASAARAKLPLTPPRAAEATAATPITLAVASPATTTTPRSSRHALWAAIGVVAIALVYVGQPEFAPPRGAEATGIDRSGMTEHVNVAPSPAVTRVEEPSWTAVGNADRATEGPDGVTGSAVAKAPVALAGPKTIAKAAKSANQEAKSMPPPLPAENEAAPKAADTESSQQLAGGKVSVPVQPADGAVVLASAMEKCGKEGLFSKFVCEQKAYMRYCEDKWEKDPRCVRKVGQQ